MVMLKAVLLGFLVSAAPLASAIGQDTGAACAGIGDDGERLACYDRVFRTAGGEAPASEAILLESERLIPAAPSGREPATLTIACEAGGPEVSFAFAGQLVSVTGDIAPLTMQVDQNATVVRTMSASADNRSLSFSSDRDTETFLDSLAGGSNLRVRVTPVRQRSLTVDYDIGDVLPAIAALRENCSPVDEAS
jgi:type VI secretion system protein VasI